MATTTLHRGACTACGWHGRRTTDEGAARFVAARHELDTGHATGTQQAAGPRPAPWDWHAA